MLKKGNEPRILGFASRQTEGQFDSRAAGARCIDRNASLVCQHNLLDDGETKAGSPRSRGDERMEDLFTLTCGNAGAVVLDGDPASAMCAVDSPFDDDRRSATNGFAGLG